MANEIMSVEGQLVGMPLAGPESFSQQQLDYLKAAMGIDETVLFNNSDPQPIITATDLSLSETVRNFERVKVYYKDYYGPDAPSGKLHMCSEGVVVPETFGLGIPGMPTGDALTVFFDLNAIMFDSTKPTKVTVVSGTKRVGLTINGSTATFNTTTSRGIFLYKVVGIHRISGGN